MNEQLTFIQQQQLNPQSVSGQDYVSVSGSMATLAAQHTMSQAAGRGANAQPAVPSQLGAMMMLNGVLGGSQRTLWIGDLAPWMDEAFLYSLFSPTNQLLSVKLIRNKATGMSEGYAFLEMKSHDAAEQVLQACNGRPIPGASDMVFRLNWAAYGVGKTSQPTSDDHSLFVGDLAPDVSDLILQEYFRQFYPSVRSAKVITDVATGRSKGYGFVRFSAENERNLALTTMNGHFLSNRPIRVSLATAKKNAIMVQQSLSQPHPSDLDPTNTTLFIGGLSSQIVEEQLRAVFSQFGDIIYVKIPQGKGCGFVQFVLRASAEQAMAAMNGRILGNSAMRISWGRSSSRSASQPGQGMPGLGVGGYGAVANGIDSQVLDQMVAAAAGYATNPQQALGNGSSLVPNQYLSSFAKVSLPLDLPVDIFSAYLNSQNAANRNFPVVNVSDEDAETGLTPFSRGMSTGGASGRTDDSGLEHRDGSLDPFGANKDSARTSTEVESLQDVSNASHPDSNCGSYVEPGADASSPQKDGQFVDQLASRDSSASHDMTPLFANLVM
jgi:RNA recognition motif-containing protein